MTDYELLDLVVGALGSAATAGALLFGFHTYQTTNLKARFERLRVDVIDLRDLVEQIDRQVDLPLFLQLSRRFGQEVLLLMPDRSKESLKKVMTSPDYQVDLNRAGLIAHTDTEAMAEAYLLFQQTNKLIAKHRGLFPVSFSIIERCVMLVNKQFQAITDISRAMDAYFEDDEMVKDVGNKIEESDSFERALRYAEALISDQPAHFMGKVGQSIINNSKAILELVAERISGASDEELQKISAKELSSNVGAGLREELITGALGVWLGQIRGTFGPAEWDEVRTRLGRLEQIIAKD